MLKRYLTNPIFHSLVDSIEKTVFQNHYATLQDYRDAILFVSIKQREPFTHPINLTNEPYQDSIAGKQPKIK